MVSAKSAIVAHIVFSVLQKKLFQPVYRSVQLQAGIISRECMYSSMDNSL